MLFLPQKDLLFLFFLLVLSSLKPVVYSVERTIQDKSWQEPTVTCNPGKDWRKLKESQGPEGGGNPCLSAVGYKGGAGRGRRQKTSHCTGSHFPIESWQEEGGDHI